MRRRQTGSSTEQASPKRPHINHFSAAYDADIEISASPSDDSQAVEERGNADAFRRSLQQRPSCEHITRVKKRSYNFVNRVPAPPKKKIRKEKWLSRLTSMTLGKLRSTKCCRRLRCFRHVSYETLMERARFLLSASTATRRNTLKSYRVSNKTFHFDGREVCVTFLKKSFRFSTELISAVRTGKSTRRRTASKRSNSAIASSRQYFNNQNSPQSPEVSVTSSLNIICKKKEVVISFLLRTAEDCGDSMPNRSEVHLPFFRHMDLYPVFQKEFKRLYPGQTEVLQDYFRRVWRENCPHIKIVKASRFTMCDTCDQIKTSLRQCILEGHSTDELKAQRAEHVAFVSRERMAYQKKKDRARLRGSEFCSIIVDGADQSAFGLPHFTTTPKSQRGHALKVKLVGLLEHKLENQLYLYTMTQEHETGANHIVEVLHRFINAKASEGPLPPKFFVQLDNCTRENKNRFVMGYFEMLVATSVFDSVEVGFLPVGHTHEDVDQAFSQTSARLRVRNAVTLEDMQHELRQTYKGNVQVGHLKRVANWSGLCNAENCLRKVDKVSQWRYFLFTPSSDNNSPCKSGEPRRTTCSVKRGTLDRWQLVGRSTTQSTKANTNTNSFLKHCPDIKKTPALVITCPEGLEDVTKRLESEEGRINDMEKLERLHDLRDFVFQPRVDPFHWDINSCVERAYLKNTVTDSDDESRNIQDGDPEAPSNAEISPTLTDEIDEITPRQSLTSPRENSVRHNPRHPPKPFQVVPLTTSAITTAGAKFTGATEQSGKLKTDTEPSPSARASIPPTTSMVGYKVGSFVIVRAREWKPRSAPEISTQIRHDYWVGKVLETICDEGVLYPNKIRVRWFDQEKASEDDYLQSKFSPCYCTLTSSVSKGTKVPRAKKKPKEVPWCDVIETASVKITFGGLTKQRTIPLCVQKALPS